MKDRRRLVTREKKKREESWAAVDGLIRREFDKAGWCSEGVWIDIANDLGRTELAAQMMKDAEMEANAI